MQIFNRFKQVTAKQWRLVALLGAVLIAASVGWLLLSKPQDIGIRAYLKSNPEQKKISIGHQQFKKADLIALYQQNEYLPLWHGSGRFRSNVSDMLAIISIMPHHGMLLEAYPSPYLRELSSKGAATLSLEDEILLSGIALRLAQDMRYGQVEDPQAFNPFYYVTPSRAVDMNALVSAIRGQDLQAFVDSMRYEHLRIFDLLSVLHRYREFKEKFSDWVRIPQTVPIMPGTEDFRVPVIRETLRKMKLYSGATDTSSTFFDPDLEKAIIALQTSYSLDYTATITRNSLIAFNDAFGYYPGHIHRHAIRDINIEPSQSNPLIRHLRYSVGQRRLVGQDPLIYDERLADAITMLKQDYIMEPTGMIEENTLRWLNIFITDQAMIPDEPIDLTLRKPNKQIKKICNALLEGGHIKRAYPCETTQNFNDELAHGLMTMKREKLMPADMDMDYSTIIALNQYLHASSKLSAMTIILPNTRDKRIVMVRMRLWQEGFLKEYSADKDKVDLYDSEVQKAVKKFKKRYAIIPPDATLTEETFTAMNVSLDDRIGQIQANIERAKWLNLERWDKEPTYLDISMPDGVLTAYRDRKKAFDMAVVFGSKFSPTPVAETQMQGLRFHRDWFITKKLTEHAVLPHLLRNPKHFEKHGYRLYRFLDLARNVSPLHEVDPSTVDWKNANPDDWAILLPSLGHQSPMGSVRFDLDFSEHFTIFLHENPQLQYFKLPFRARSNGCIRVEHPLDLAEFAFDVGHQSFGPEDAERIYSSPQFNVSGNSVEQVHPLDKPIPVLMRYDTVRGNGDNWTIYPDVYEWDKKLVRAVRNHTTHIPSVDSSLLH